MVRFSENIAKISTHNTAQPDVNYPPPLVDMIEKGYSWIVISFVKKKKEAQNLNLTSVFMLHNNVCFEEVKVLKKWQFF